MVIGRNPADKPYLEWTLILRLDMYVAVQLGSWSFRPHVSHLPNDLGWTPSVLLLQEMFVRSYDFYKIQ